MAFVPPPGPLPFPHFDPNYNFWYNNFAWWYYSGADHGSSYLQIDPKISRMAYSLAGLVARDRLTREQAEKLTTMKFKIFDFAVDGDMPAMIESLGVKVEAPKPTDIHLHVLSQKLYPNQILVINALYQPQSKEIFQAIANFVYDGGRLLVFNSASHLISAMFPGRIAPMTPSTIVSGRVNFLGPEIELFSSWTPNETVDLEFHRYPIEVSDAREVKVLAEVKHRIVEPVVVQFDHGSGGVYVFVSRLFLHEKDKSEISPADLKKEKEAKRAELVKKEEESKQGVEEMKIEGQKRKPQQKKKKIAPPPKKQKAPEVPEDFESYLNKMGASGDTFIAWRCAVNVGFTEAYNMSKRVFPCIEMIGKLLLKQQAILEDMFVRPSDIRPPQELPELEETTAVDESKSEQQVADNLDS